MTQSELRQLKEICAVVMGPRLTGTGYFVARNRLVTAYHIVEPLQEGDECKVFLGLDHSSYTAQLLRIDKLADAAIMTIESVISVAPLPVAHTVWNGDRWRAFGFPNVAKRKGLWTGVPLDGRVQDRHAENKAHQQALLLYSPQIGSGSGSPLHGFSGSPVVIGGAIAGHLTEILGDTEDRMRAAYGYVYACPIGYVQALLDIDLPSSPLSAVVSSLKSFDEAGTCWAREEELNALVGRVVGSRRSLTLLSGDSGIGKSTVLRELVARLREYPGLFIGSFECSAADLDPLLNTLDRLLAQLYAIPDASANLRSACLALREDASVRQSRPFMINLRRTVLLGTLAAGGLSLFANTVIDALDWMVEDEFQGVPRALANRLPTLDMEAFQATLKILQKAFPNGQFVFVIDNLSAPGELPGDTRRPWEVPP
jgi:AAA ATPase domain/Trypsin-like peptidase domain